MDFITSKREYREIYDDNQRTVGDLFIFLSKKIPEDIFKVGIVVSKKVGNAVIRNKLKRRIKAFLRENPQFHPNRAKLVIIAKPKAGIAQWSTIKDSLSRDFKLLNENF